jgi:hypothetical protein
LHGKQIATTIFEFMHVPKFDQTNEAHRQLAAISLAAHKSRAAAWTTDFLEPSQEDELTALVRSIAAK